MSQSFPSVSSGPNGGRAPEFALWAVAAPARPKPRHARGLTLLEVLIVVSLIALLGGGVLLGPGALRSTQVRAAATLLVSGVRLGITRANNTGRPVRLVLDFETRRVLLEEATSKRFVREHDAVAGGAEAADEAERAARAEVDPILDGPRAPRAAFRPIKELSDPEGGEPGRALGAGVEVVYFQTERDDQPLSSGRAYLYFWPGGLTERAAIHLKKAGGDDPGLTVMVSALTGRASIKRGRVELPMAREDDGFSERDER